MQIPQHILILIEKYLADSATEEEKSIVNKWYQSYQDESVEIVSSEINSKEQTELRIKERLLATISETENRKGINKWWMRSAAAVVLIGLAVFFFVPAHGAVSVDHGLWLLEKWHGRTRGGISSFLSQLVIKNKAL